MSSKNGTGTVSISGIAFWRFLDSGIMLSLIFYYVINIIRYEL